MQKTISRDIVINTCNKCGYTWEPRQDRPNVLVCARCKSYAWNDGPREKK